MLDEICPAASLESLGMASDKRERQRANRELKRAELAKTRRRQTMITRGRRIAISVVIGVLALAALLFFGSSSEAAAALAGAWAMPAA